MIWLRDGLVEDRDTDGHSDNITQFVRPGVVLAQAAPDRSNPNWDGLNDNLARLRKQTDAAGHKLEVIEMPVLPYVEVGGEQFVVPYTTTSPSTAASSRGGGPDDEANSPSCASSSPTATSWVRRAGCWPMGAAASAASRSSSRRASRSPRSHDRDRRAVSGVDA